MTYDSKIHIWPVDMVKTRQHPNTRTSWKAAHEAWPQLMINASTPKPYKIIIDANMVLADMQYKCDNPSIPTFLECLCRDNMIELHAPHWLISELRCGEAMSNFLKGYPHLSSQDLWHQWPAIQDLLTIDHTYAYPIQVKMCGILDLKDEPYCRMANDYHALGVLSRDNGFAYLKLRHLRRQDLRPLGVLAGLLNESFDLRVTIVGVPSMSMFGLGAGVKFVYKKIPALPKEVQYIMLFGATIALISMMFPRSRNHITSKGKIALQTLKPILNEYVKVMAKSYNVDHKIDALIFEIEEGRVKKAT